LSGGREERVMGHKQLLLFFWISCSGQIAIF
jgi:hypothetical protein